MRAVILAPFALLLACGPVPVQQAERDCLERARMAEKPQASVFIGVNNKGEVLKGGSFGVTTDYLAGRDPSAVFNECVKSRSGQFPTRSYSEFPPAR
jgi:hypothetical protein